MDEQLDLFEAAKCDSCRGTYTDAHFAPYCSVGCVEHIIGIMQEARIPDRFFIRRLQLKVNEWNRQQNL